MKGVEEPGWYKLYLYGPMGKEPCATSWAGRPSSSSANMRAFPTPPKGTEGGSYPSEDEVMRGVAGIGPQRHAVPDASKPDEAIRKLSGDVALDRKYYLPFDPVRKRALMVAFPNGTKDLDGVRKVVGASRGTSPTGSPGTNPTGAAPGPTSRRRR